MTDSTHPSATPNNDDLEQRTRGHAGQQGYDSGWHEGRYTDETIAESGGSVDDRAGSYESGFAVPNRDDALEPQPKNLADIGPDSSNNYTDADSNMEAPDAVSEEE